LSRWTVNEGVFSEWNGQSPLKLLPAAFKLTYSETTFTMSAELRTVSEKLFI
jgi:hypothetical protein